MNDWHISDHRPITLELEVNANIDMLGLLKRAVDLNYINNDTDIEIHQFKGSYDYEAIAADLLSRKDATENDIRNKLHNNDLLRALDTLDLHMKSVH